MLKLFDSTCCTISKGEIAPEGDETVNGEFKDEAEDKENLTFVSILLSHMVIAYIEAIKSRFIIQ